MYIGVRDRKTSGEREKLNGLEVLPVYQDLESYRRIKGYLGEIP